MMRSLIAILRKIAAAGLLLAFALASLANASAASTPAVATPGSQSAITTSTFNDQALTPFMMNYYAAGPSLSDVSFLLDPPAGHAGFIQVKDGHLVKPDGKRIRFWGFNLTEWSRGSWEVPSKEDAPLFAAALARFGVNCVRLHFLDLAAPRGLLDGTLNDSQHFNAEQLDREDFFINELKKRGIYVDLNLNVGRSFKAGDGIQTFPGNQWGKGLTLFDKRLVELQKDYARQLLTHLNPYTKTKYCDEPAVAIVELVNENAIYLGFNSSPFYNQELTDLYNAWLQKTLSPQKLASLRQLAGVAAGQPVPRLTGQAARNAPQERYHTEMDFFRDLQTGFFKDMESYLKGTLGVKSPIIATADHAHSGSSYPLLMSTSQLDIVDGHTYWQHPNDRAASAAMVNDPFNSSVVELSRSAFAGKPYTVSEVNHPFPSPYAGEGIPILAAYAGFQDWDGIFWYTFERKKDPAYKPAIGDAFDMSYDPVKMPQIAAAAVMFERGDVAPSNSTVERSYTREQAYDSTHLGRTERPYFTPGFPLSTPLIHGSRIKTLGGSQPGVWGGSNVCPLLSDTGELAWLQTPEKTGMVTVETDRSQALIGFVKAHPKTLRNLAAELNNSFYSLILTSMDDRAIAGSGKLLLTVGVRAVNSRAGSPTLIEPATGKVTLRNLNQAVAVSVQPLDGAGQALGAPLVANKSAAGWEFALGSPITTWYLVTVRH